MNLEKTKKIVFHAQVTICSLITISVITIARNYNPDQSIFSCTPKIILAGLDTLLTLSIIWALANMTIFKHSSEWSKGAVVIFYYFFIIISLAVMMIRFLYHNGYIEIEDLFVVKNAETIVLGITFIASVINPRYGIANTVAIATVMYIFIEPNNNRYLDAIVVFGIAMALGSIVKFVFLTNWTKYVKEKAKANNEL